VNHLLGFLLKISAVRRDCCERSTRQITDHYGGATFVVVFMLLVLAGLFVSIPAEFMTAPVETALVISVPDGELVFNAGGGCSAGALVD
jgi:hypothetical protein